MTESKGKNEFTRNLLAQDPPLVHKQQQHKEVLLKRIERRMCLQKAAIIAAYMALFLLAFGSFNLRRYTDNVVHSICWGTVSLHVLLWSLVYILRGISMQIEELIDKKFDNDEKRRNRSQNLLLTIWAIIVFVLSSAFLCRSFFLTDSLKAAQTAVSILWATIFFLIFYPFRTASLIAKLWLQYKKMELDIAEPEEQHRRNPGKR